MVRSNKQDQPRVSSTYFRSLSSTTMTTTTDGSGDGKTQTNKKQMRRRLHTSRPYQERLLNMAEARREIVTALKQHRASMRQAAKNIPPPPPPQNLFSPPLPPPPPPDPFTWTTNPSLNFLLPNQPLGLNLNFHDFNDFIQTSSTSSSSSSSTSSSSSSIFPTNPHIYSSPSPPPTFAATSDYAPSSVGENQQQQMMMMESENNVATSTWWSELMMKTVEPEIIKPEEEVVLAEDDVFPKLNDVMEFPSWLNTTEEELFHPYNLTHYSSLHNPPLSCMEIGEIEGMDGDDWFCLNPKD